MKAISLACVLFLCAGAAQSQSVYLEYTDPFGDGTALMGLAQVEVKLWIDFPVGGKPSSGGGVNVLYDSQLTDLNQVNPQLPICPMMPTSACVSPGMDDNAGTISGIIIQTAPGTALQGMHHVATLVFDALDVGIAAFTVEENTQALFGIPVDFNTITVSIVLPSCESGSLPENFHQADASGLPSNWVSIFPVNSVDSDGDGVDDDVDNCTLLSNADQLDTNGDGFGNVCDPDVNNDCTVDFIDVEILMTAFNSTPGDPSWNPDADFDGDLIVNFRDLTVMQSFEGGPPGPSGIPNNCTLDADGDGIGDASDNCVLVANESQCDTDADGYGNHCDADMDNDCSSNFTDLGIMKTNFFMPGSLVSDLNCDNFTNFADLSIMKDLFFLPPGPSGLTNDCDGPQAKSGATGWKTTAGDFCDFNGDFIGDNVTGGLAQAACLKPPIPVDGAALCTQTPLAIANAINPILELHANFQPKGTGTFKVTAGTAPPTPAAIASYSTLYEIDQQLGGFRSLPGETLIIDLPAVTPLYVCVVVDGDFDYAQVDHCIACALSCGGTDPTGPSRNPDCGVERP